MIANPTAHRRANAFADALEGEGPQTDAGVQHGAHAADRHADPRQGTLLALADALQDVPRPTLDAETKTVQRAQLIAAMEAALADGTLTVPVQRDGGRGAHRAGSRGPDKLKPRSAWSRRLAAGGLSVGVAAGALGGVAAASTDALPGDTLYGLKRGMEDMRLNLADDDADRGKVYLDLASTRLQEARRLMERGRGGELDDESVGEIRRALSGMQQEAAEGHRLLAAAYRKDGSLRPIETLSAFSSNHRKGWTELRGRLPSRLDDVGNRVTSVFDAIEDEVAPLQKLLPSDTGSGHDAGRGIPGSGDRSASGTQGPSPSVSGSPSSSADERGGDKASPSASRSSADSGFIGGTGDLIDPPPSGGYPGDDGTRPSVTLPPLLPGLLPGLGLSAEDDRDD